MTTRIAFSLWLVFVWVALWGDVTWGNVAGGALVAAALLTLFPHAGPSGTLVVRPFAALRFLGHFIFKLVEANAVVAWEVITPNNENVNEGIVAVPMEDASDGLITLLANAISLTPGTLTLEVRDHPPMLFVHVLHLRSIEQTRADVHRLESLARRAFEPGATADANANAEEAS